MASFGALNNALGDKLEKAKSAVGLGVDKAMLYIQTAKNANLGTQALGHHVGETLKNAGKKALNGNLMGTGAGGKNALDKGYFYAMKVQYNPSTIRISAHSDEISVRSHQLQQDDEIHIEKIRPPSVTLSVDLVFDDVSPPDCFTGSIFNPSLKSAFETGASFFIGKFTHSVQPQTNALIGMLMRLNTRLVCFQWDEMTFVGEVNMVDAKYTMFNKDGEPVRSVVSLSLLQQVMEKDTISYWDDAFNKFFGAADTTGKVSANNLSNKVKGLVNIPFLK